MRALPLLLAALVLLAGCSSPKEPASLSSPQDDLADTAAAPDTGGLAPLQFAAGSRESDLPLDLTWTASESCVLADAAGMCPQSLRTVDLTPIVPAGAPVEMSIRLTGDGNYGLQLDQTDSTIIRYVEDYDSGTYRIDATLVRAPSGTVALTVQYVLPSVLSAAGAELAGDAHTISRAEVVPAFVPVAVELAAGDVLNVTGDGIEQAALFGLTGTALRVVEAPFVLRVPDGAPAGTYVVVAAADEAVRIEGPAGRTLVARQLQMVHTEPVDIVGGAASWTMTMPGQPLAAGVVVGTKESLAGSAVAAYPGNFQVKLTSPANVDVVLDQQDCLVLYNCGFALLGSYSFGYATEILDEHLVPGDYSASVTMDGGRDMQGYSWAVTL